MDDQDLLACLRLHRCPKLSNQQRCQLLTNTNNPAQIFELSASQLVRYGLKPAAINYLQQPTLFNAQLQQDIELLTTLNIQLLPICDTRYPALLQEIHNPPALLYARGNLELLSSVQLAIVGSRRTTQAGRDNAFSFARAFAAAGATITSGMALGIDSECHRGALAVPGQTIAVLGTGVDIIYPRRNGPLYQQLIEQGLVVSELPLSSPPRPSQFPSRNRIISGLSLGVLVVEAALQSGSLITARLAMEQGREVFALPGSIHNPSSRGCHSLIRQGATLVESTDHILEELQGWSLRQAPSQPATDSPAELEPSEQQLLDQLGFDWLPLDYLQQLTRWPVAKLTATLTGLELKGLLESRAGCYQRIKN